GGSLTLGAIGLVLWNYSRMQTVPVAFIYPAGVVWKTHGNWFGLRWEEVDEIYREEFKINGMWKTREVRLAGSMAKEPVTVTLGHQLSNWTDLARQLEERIGQAQLQKAAIAYQKGEWLDYGPIAISQDGLRLEDKEFPWTTITDLQMGNGVLIVVA